MEKIKNVLKTTLPYLLTIVTLTLGMAGISFWEMMGDDSIIFNQIVKFALGGVLIYIAFSPAFDSWLKFWKQMLS